MEQDCRGEWAEFLGRYPLDVFFTCTFSDDYANEHYVYSHTSALNNFERFLNTLNYGGQFFVAAEGHRDRAVPHLHGLMQAATVQQSCLRPDLELSAGDALTTLWGAWFAERGRCRFESPRSDAVNLYCVKYALKDRNADEVRFRLGTEKTRGRAKSWPPPGAARRGR